MHRIVSVHILNKVMHNAGANAKYIAYGGHSQYIYIYINSSRNCALNVEQEK